MDVGFLRCVDFEAISAVTDTLDPEIGIVLDGLAVRSRKDVEGELLRSFDLKSLLEARKAVFRGAMDKVDVCLSHVAKARALDTFVPSAKEEKMITKANRLFRCLTPRDMILRKCIKRTVNDIIELLMFIGGNGGAFPIMMMKTKANGGGRKSLGGFSSDDIECLQHISSLMFSDDDPGVRPGEIYARTGSKDDVEEITETCQIDSNGTHNDEDGKPIISTKYNKVPIAERVSSRMYGHIVEENCKEGKDSIDHTASNVPYHDCGLHEPDMERMSDIEIREHVADVIGGNACMSEVGTLSLCVQDVQDVPMNTTNSPTIEQAPYANPISRESHEAVEFDAVQCPPECVAEVQRESTYAGDLPDPCARAHVRKPAVLAPLPNESVSQDPPVLPASIVISIGDRVVKVDISDMASRYPTDAQSWTDRRGSSHRQERGCDGCDRKIEEQARRVSVIEDKLNEEVRKLRIENDGLVDELRNVKKKLKEPSSTRTAVGVQGRTMSSGNMENVNPRERATRPERGQPELRQRAFSFAGTAARGGARPRATNANAGAGQGTATADLPPKPQREKVKKVRPAMSRQGGGDRENIHEDNPIRSWLTSKKGESAPVTTSRNAAGDDGAIRSPSWADDVSTSEGESNSSYLTTPTPSPDQRAVNIEDSPNPRAGPAVQVEDDDVYLLPPSGQVTERSTNNRNSTAPRKSAPNGQGGARPKGRGKNGNVGRDDVNKSTAGNSGPVKQLDSRNGRNTSESYAKIVTKNGWTTKSKKRKYNNVSPRAAFPLRGIPVTVNRHVYLQGLDMGDGMSNEDIADSIKSYCHDYGITPVFIRIIPVRYDVSRTGCKLTIKEEDYDRVIMSDFWPEDVTVRDWTPKPRDNDENQ